MFFTGVQLQLKGLRGVICGYDDNGVMVNRLNLTGLINEKSVYLLLIFLSFIKFLGWSSWILIYLLRWIVWCCCQ